MTRAVFFDSYASIEVLKGNPAYDPYLNASRVMTKLNAFEIGHYLLKVDFPQAQDVLSLYYRTVVDFNMQTIAAAIQLKLHNRKLSMTDCIGYALAKKLDIPFLTGDKEFKHMDNVLFVK